MGAHGFGRSCQADALLRSAHHSAAHRPTRCATADLCTVVELHNDELYSSEQQGDIALKAHIASVCFKCFKCFRDMLHVFQMDVAKVDWDVAYVAMVVQVCYKGLFLMFHLCFQTYVASVFI
jgi:hypothetical protein